MCGVHGDPPNFVTASRDGETIVEMMWTVYIRVDDVDAIYAEVQERGTEIDYTIYSAPHGFREFGVTDPDGYDVAFGQRIAA